MAGRDETNELADQAILLYRERKVDSPKSKEPPRPISMTEAVWLVLRKKWPNDDLTQRRQFRSVMERITSLNLEKKVSEGRRAPETPKPRPEAQRERRPVQTEFPGVLDYEPARDDLDDYMGHSDVSLGRSRR